MNAFVIAGATGHVGSVAAEDLLARGEKVKVIVRDEKRGDVWRGRGADVAVGSLGDTEFLSRTLSGAAGFFTLLPPEIHVDDIYAAQRRAADAIAAAVKASRVPYVVLLSSVGADLAEGTGPIKGLHYLENALRATGAKVAAVRATFFQENIAGVLPAVRNAGVYPNFLPSADAAVPMVATRDIGHLAAELLSSPSKASEVVDMVGPSYSVRQLAEKLQSALGKPVQIVDVPAGGYVAAFMQAGFPPSAAAAFAEMYTAAGAGLLTLKGDRTVAGSTEIDEVLPGLLAKGAGQG